MYFPYAALALYTLRSAHGQIRVLSPELLAQQFADTHGIIYGTTATFGAPYYGQRVLGQLLYAESHGGQYCTSDDYEMDSQINSGSSRPVNIFLIRRGRCTFVTKVRIAQEKSAHAVIVIDKESSALTSEDVQRIIMADDGYGDSVKIPSLLISRFDGEKLLTNVQQGPVMVELAWDIPRSDVVLADFWMSAGSRETNEFMNRFKYSAETLGYNLQFVPHYHVFGLPVGSDQGHLCIDKASRYCAADPDGPGPLTGADVVREDLRQLCIWNVTARSQPGSTTGAVYSQEFWDYVVAFFHRCPLGAQDKSHRFGEKCSFRLMRAAGLDVNSIRDCTERYSETLLDDQVRNVAWSPQALRLNGWRYSGPLDPQTVLQAICSGYANPPKACDELMGGYAEIQWISIPGISFGSFAWMLFLLVLCLASTFVCYRRHLTMVVRRKVREEVMLEVQTQMADYAYLSDGPEMQGRGRPLSF